MSRKPDSGDPFGADDGGGMPQRKSVNKERGAKQFRGDTTRTKKINLAAAPMRGGWRL